MDVDVNGDDIFAGQSISHVRELPCPANERSARSWYPGT
jgi:hypothetical protein